MTEKKCTDYTRQGRWINRVSRFWHRNTLALTAVVFLAALFVWTMADGQSFVQGCSQLYDGVLRLHILANSDSEADQQLKLRVRDRVKTAPSCRSWSNRHSSCSVSWSRQRSRRFGAAAATRRSQHI